MQNLELRMRIEPVRIAFECRWLQGVTDIELQGTITILKEGTLQASKYPNVSPPTYKAFYDTLFNALEGRSDVPVSARDARNVIKIVELAKESSKMGVTISIQPEEFA